MENKREAGRSAPALWKTGGESALRALNPLGDGPGRPDRAFRGVHLFYCTSMVTRTGIELIRTPDVVFSKRRKKTILRHLRELHDL